MKAKQIISHFLTFLLFLTHAIAAAQQLAITNVIVIDVQEGVAKPAMTVIVTDNLISAVGIADAVAIPASARVIDATGKYLIPGLWDMHVHTSSDKITRETMLPLYIANGVTGIRIMKADCFEPCDNIESSFETVQQWRRDISEGNLVGPRIIAASALIQAPAPGTSGNPWAPTNEAEARRLVKLAKNRGVDFLKPYDMLGREAYFAMAEEAKKQNIPFSGHVPIEVKASEASRVGQKSIEHLSGILEECSGQEDALRKRLIDELNSESPYVIDLVLEMISSFSEDKCKALYSLFVDKNTWHVPTALMFSEFEPHTRRSRWREDLRTKYLSKEERQYWEESQEYEIWFSKDGAHMSINRKFRDIVLDMYTSGVKILAGSDAGGWGAFPGFSLHDELGHLADLGLPPAEVLKAATLRPAEFLQATDSLGTVDQGKLADLVLLNANPLEDISNTQKIHAVMVNGRYLDRQALDKLLTEVEQAANPEEEDKTQHKNKI